MKHFILHSYHLPSKRYSVLKKKIKNDELFLFIFPRAEHCFCPECGKKSTYHYDTKKKFSKIKYDRWYSHTIWLCLRKRRFLCQNNDCSKTVFTEVIPEIAGRYQRSSPLFQIACLKELKDHNFLSVQKKMNVSYSYLAGQLNIHVKTNSWNIDWKKEFEGEDYISLGIDEHGHKKRKLALTVTNITKGKIIAILPKYNKIMLDKFLRSIPSQYRKRMLFAATDLTNRYGNTIRAWLPNVRVVADHFHLVGLLNNVLWREKRVIEELDQGRKIKYFKLLLKARERLTREEKMKINFLLKNNKYNRLKRAYEFKENMRTILNDKDIERARQDFLNLLEKDVWNNYSTPRKELLKYSKFFRTCLETLKKWKYEILAFIETRITNAYTEGIHTKIKLLKRLSFGLPNINIYIKRMILALSPLFHHI